MKTMPGLLTNRTACDENTTHTFWACVEEWTIGMASDNLQGHGKILDEYLRLDF